MIDYTQIIIGLSGGLIGGSAVALVQSILDKRKQIELSFNKLMEDKYRSLLIFMACALDISKRKYFSLNEQTPNKTSQDYLKQIREYYYHGLLYSSDEVILSLKQFINKPTKQNYIKTALAMRKELWNKRTKLANKDIVLD